MRRLVGKGPGIPLEIPKDSDVIEYLASFSPAFSKNQNMQKALGGVQDSFRQAKMMKSEPLGLFACLTAEEEAASFLYRALIAKEYDLPPYKELKDHGNKVKIFLLCKAIIHYYFREEIVASGLRIRIEGEKKRPLINCFFPISAEYKAVISDPFAMVVTRGKGDEGYNRAIHEAVDQVVQEASEGHRSLSSAIEFLKNRRNMCIYGPLKQKYALRDEDELTQYISNATSILACGFIIYFKSEKTDSMGRIIDKMFKRLELR